MERAVGEALGGWGNAGQTRPRCGRCSGCRWAGRGHRGPEVGQGRPPWHPRTLSSPDLPAGPGPPCRLIARRPLPSTLCAAAARSSRPRSTPAGPDRRGASARCGRQVSGRWRRGAARAGALQPESATREPGPASAALSRAPHRGPEPRRRSARPPPQGHAEGRRHGGLLRRGRGALVRPAGPGAG